MPRPARDPILGRPSCLNLPGDLISRRLSLLSLPALTAGLGLGGLIWLCVRQFGKRITRKREKQMRRIIGGELALQKLREK